MNTLTDTQILFRPSMIGDLMTDGRGKKGEMGQTAKSYIRALWMENTFGYRKTVCTDAMLKGIMCEDESIELVQAVLRGQNRRTKNLHKYSNDHIEGTPDVVLPASIEEIKTSQDLETFAAVDTTAAPDKGYLWQVQAYLWLTGRVIGRLIYCLVPTPELILCNEKNRLFYRFGCQENHPEYLYQCGQIDHNNEVIRLLPAADRIKVFEIEYDPQMIEALKERIELAREYYHTLRL